MSYGNGIKLTAGFDVGAKTPLDSKSVVQTIAERDAFVTDNLVYEGLEVYVKDTRHKYRYEETGWIDLDAQSGSESGTGEGLTTEQANQLTTAYEHSQTPHVSADDIPTNISDLTNDSGFITSIPEEYITETELEAKGYLTSHQDISNLQSKTDNNLATTSKEVVGAINEVKSSVDGITVPTKTSDLTNDSNFITSIPEEYITETELETKGYLTEHQSLTDYAKKIDIPDVSDFLTEVPAGYVTDTKLSTELDKKVNKEVGKGLSTNDLTNELVTKINSSATEAFVTNAIANAQLGSGEVDLSGYATVDALNLKADLTHTHDQYLTKVPDEYITETELNAKGYLTEHQDISNLALKSEIPDVSSFITSDDLPTVPTKVSDLANDKNYISSIPSEYVTETELTAKKYLTSIPSTYALKTDIPTIPTKTSDLTNDSGFIDNTTVVIVNKGDSTTEVNIDNDIPSGSTTMVLTGRVVSSLYDNQLVTTNKGDNSMTIWDTKGSKVVFNKSNGSWAKSSSATHVYNTDASAIYQKINDSTLTTTDKTVVGAINELKSGLDGIKVPTKTSELTNNSGFITTIPDEYITETELNAKGYLTSHQDISNLQTKTDNNLVTTSKEVVGAINEVKSSNDTKLNKTDANKLNCVTIDNVSLKEYILTNFTETEEKTHHLIAKTTCTDLPKASNFYITVETPGAYTYKVTAKELNDSNGRYVCTYRTISSSWTEWEKVLITGDITTTINSTSTDTQIPTAKAVNDVIKTNVVGKETVLYDTSISATGTYTLADDVNNYDFIVINFKTNKPIQSEIISKTEILRCNSENSYVSCVNGHGNGTSHLNLYFQNDKMFIISVDSTTLSSITGYKFGQITVQNTITNPSPEQSYSLDEQLTGGTWIDGKPIYRKTVDYGTLPNTGNKTISHNISNIDTIIKVFGVAKNSNGTFISLPSAHPDGLDFSIEIKITSTDISVETGSDRANYTQTYVTIEYTKTTDA